MTETDKIAMVKIQCDEDDEATISAALLLAGEELTSFFNIFVEEKKAEFLDKYAAVHVKAAAYILNKRGWDFQTGHSENGISRTFETGNLPDSILRMIPAQCKVVT
jgi:hypothetical protein